MYKSSKTKKTTAPPQSADAESEFIRLVRLIPGYAFDAAVKKAPIATLDQRALCELFRKVGK